MADESKHGGGELKLLHLYPGATWHDDAAIVGTRASLLELREAIDAALRDDAAVAGAFVKDGEGYWIFVHVVAENEMRKMAVPYTDDIAREPEDSNAVWPSDLEARAMDAYRAKVKSSRES